MTISVIAALAIIFVIWLSGFGRGYRRFVDPKGGFTMSYPARWEKMVGANGTAVLFLSPPSTPLDIYRENVNIVVQDTSRNPLELKDYSELAVTQMKAVFKSNLSVIEDKSVWFAGQPGHKFMYIGYSPDQEVSLKFLQLSQLFLVGFNFFLNLLGGKRVAGLLRKPNIFNFFCWLAQFLCIFRRAQIVSESTLCFNIDLHFFFKF